MSKRSMLKMGMVMSAVLATSFAKPAAADDAYVTMAKAYVAKATAPVTVWDGPTTGPKAVGHKVVIFVSADQRNGGLLGVSEGAEQASKIIGWDLRIIDGQGTVSGRASALTQAIASKPDAIILGSVDAKEQASLIAQAAAAGIKIVSWHAGPTPGKIAGSPIFTNVTTDPAEIGKAAGLYAVAASNGHANVILFTDSIYAIATTKTDAEKAAIEGCAGCSVLAVEDTPLGAVSERMPQLTTALIEKYGSKWTYSIGINDLYFDFMAPSLAAAGIPGNGDPHNISAGDGSEAAFNRIRNQHYQIATVAEPLYLDGWQLIDELNRDFAGQPPSGYHTPVHIFTRNDIDSDGGQKDIYDPADGYQAAYEKIWGVKH
ncbi:substrate-binding domain-containing protein [Acidocella sp.]|uniref:substrate-binding domain-containing protein n=1 Tax=Acidocella sp. TaxID=50710 RepID=UPI001827A3B8|nr:substrate-binding domain-containing protein [Acidocella sp.]NNM56920.1 substrate-binding domain-containing protein [Acidocella sp.]